MSYSVLTPFEIEHFVAEIPSFDLKELGNSAWLKHHDRMCRLNMQCHIDAQSKHDEYIVECFNNNTDSLHHVIRDLLSIELWRLHIYPILLPSLSDIVHSKVYVLLYHEAVLVNLLEVLLYHSSIVQSIAPDYMLELIDYLERQIRLLQIGTFNNLQQDNSNDTKALINETLQQTLERQRLTLQFQISMLSLTLLRFITDQLNHLHLSLISRMINHQDVCMRVIDVLLATPWKRTNNKGNTEKYIQQQWQVVNKDDMLVLTQLEGQVWLLLYNLLLDKNCRMYYQWTPMRKDQVLKLRRYFNDILLDQLPLLRELKRFVEELSLIETPAQHSSNLAIIEQIPEIRDAMMRDHNWQVIARHQLDTIFANDATARKRDIMKLASLYNMDHFATLDPVCAQCTLAATKRCSLCKEEWYCSRECQVAAWKSHEPLCKIRCDEKKKMEAERKKIEDEEEREVNKHNKKQDDSVQQVTQQLQASGVSKKIQIIEDDTSDVNSMD